MMSKAGREAILDWESGVDKMKSRVHSMSRRPGGNVELWCQKICVEMRRMVHDKVCSRPSFRSEMPSL
jgi:hypothetical protein